LTLLSCWKQQALHDLEEEEEEEDDDDDDDDGDALLKLVCYFSISLVIAIQPFDQVV
jgi:hypothetical protein